jgi:CheY-like chemotaxis protein
VDCVESGERALHYLNSQLPDFILLDAMMPGMDGMEVLRRIRNDRRTARLPVVMFSAISDPAYKEAALKKGADENMANLKKLKGGQFDKAYIDHEVTYHEQVLDAIDKVLVPSAQNAELKGLIEKVRPAFQAHLDHAKHVQADLGKKM